MNQCSNIVETPKPELYFNKIKKKKKEISLDLNRRLHDRKKIPVALPPEPGGPSKVEKYDNLFIGRCDNSFCIFQFGARYLLLGAYIGMLLLPLSRRAASSGPSGSLLKMLCILDNVAAAAAAAAC